MTQINKNLVDHKWCSSPKGCAAWNKSKNKCGAMSGDYCPNPERKLKDDQAKVLNWD